MYQGEYEKALQELDTGAKIEPNHPLVKIFRSFVVFYQGKVDESITILKEVLDKNAKMAGIRPILGVFLASQGKREEALAQLSDETKSLAKSDHDMSYWMAQVHSVLGETDESFKWLERAIKLGNENKQWFEKDICLKNIRQNPHFKELMDKIEH